MEPIAYPVVQLVYGSGFRFAQINIVCHGIGSHSSLIFVHLVDGSQPIFSQRN